VSSSDTPSLSTKDDLDEDNKATSQHGQEEIAICNDQWSGSVAAAPTASVSHNIDKSGKSTGGRFLKRSESGNNWIQVSAAEAMEKASHALRGLPRRSGLGNCRSSSFSTSLATDAATIRAATVSNPFASPSFSVFGSTREKDARDRVEELPVETSLRRAKKKPRHSKSDSQQQPVADSTTVVANASNAVTTAVVPTALHMSSSTSQWKGYESAIRDTPDSLRGVRFPTILQNAFCYPNLEQIAFSLTQQQLLQVQCEEYLAALQQKQEEEHQTRIEPLRQEIQRQIAVEILAQQLVQQEQEQLQTQHQQRISVPTEHHDFSSQQLSQLLALQVSSNSALASFRKGSTALPQQQQQQQRQRNLMLQQLLMGIDASDRRRDDGKEAGIVDGAKPPAR
jgi:hypothetical protein